MYLVKTLRFVQDTTDLSSTSTLFLEGLDFVVFIDYCMDPLWQKKTVLICGEVYRTSEILPWNSLMKTRYHI